MTSPDFKADLRVITIEALPLDAVGRIPGERGNDITLHRALAHMIYETSRHAGHADVVRELVDGAAGQRAEGDNMAPGDASWWAEHRERVERAAKEADRLSSGAGGAPSGVRGTARPAPTAPR